MAIHKVVCDMDNAIKLWAFYMTANPVAAWWRAALGLKP